MRKHILTTLMTGAVLLSGFVAAAQTPPRDAATVGAAGTATIRGVVLLDDRDPVPMRRATVTLNGASLKVGRTVITEDDGHFRFDALPEGRFTVSASKEAFVAIAYGATRAGRPGSDVAVKAGETREIELRMPRGAVIAGTITDEGGQPVPMATVRLMRYAYTSGERQLVPYGSQRLTDDRGAYRMYGIETGEYIVSASVRTGILGGPDVRQMTDADVRAARRDLTQSATSTQARPGISSPVSSDAEAGPRPRPSGYAPVYFPGTTVTSQAAVLQVRAGEQRMGVDIQMQMVPLARISGVLSGPQPKIAAEAMVTLIASDQTLGAAVMDTLRSTRTGADGMFAINDVPPGRYTLFARPPGSGAPAASPPGTPQGWWATTEIALDGNDVAGLPLEFLPGLTLSGRLVFEGSAAPPDASTVSLALQALQAGPQLSLAAQPTTAAADGTFAIAGVTPGRYRVNAAVRSATAGATWSLKSIVVDGTDTLDRGLDVRQSVGNIVVTLTDRPSSFAGVVRNARGEPWAGGYVVVFPRDESLWGRDSRRIRAARPSTDGRFTIAAVPPGDYLLVALTDIEQGEWFDPAVLRRLAPGAVRASVAEGEARTLDLMLR